jgi:Ca2+-binding RTX toxin-like protein
MMKSSAILLGITCFVAGCGLAQDQGVVMGCFGLINETIPGQGVFTDQIVTNSYFGGCDPSDPGMQIVERATVAASNDQSAMAAACDADCNARLAAYATTHPEVKLPISCQTLFAIPCDGIGADVSQITASGSAFQAGGPADERIALSGTITLTIDNRSQSVPATGIVDATLAPCQGANQNCALTLSRLDVIATQSFTLNGVAVDNAHVQNQGLAVGSKSAGNIVIGSNAIEAEVSADMAGTPTAFHVRNNAAIQKNGTNLTLDQFFASLSIPMMVQSGVSVSIQMTGTPAGHRPTSAFTPQTATYECQCQSCTTVAFTSAAGDDDNDLQSLSWILDGTPQAADGTNDPQVLNLSLPVGPHSVSLVATDTRGAAAASSLSFSVVDTTPPVVTPPPNVQLLSCSFPDIGRATATDICSGVVVVTSNASGNYPIGTTTVTWTAEDGSLNDGTATQTVTVTQAPNSACCPAGSNIILGDATHHNLVGTAGPDCIIGTDGNDVIQGLGGDDVLIGLGGQDQIFGGDGNDIILGGDGDDVLDGGAGDDHIAGGTGQDRITGGAGNDILIGGDGVDTIDGGDGDDVIYGNQGKDLLTGGNGNDFIDGGLDDDQINGNAGDDTLVGSFDNDAITDTIGNNAIEGFTGDDHLTGGPGDDSILGGKGHNTCIGGGGTDTLSFCNN